MFFTGKSWQFYTREIWFRKGWSLNLIYNWVEKYYRSKNMQLLSAVDFIGIQKENFSDVAPSSLINYGSMQCIVQRNIGQMMLYQNCAIVKRHCLILIIIHPENSQGFISSCLQIFKLKRHLDVFLYGTEYDKNNEEKLLITLKGNRNTNLRTCAG